MELKRATRLDAQRLFCSTSTLAQVNTIGGTERVVLGNLYRCECQAISSHFRMCIGLP